VKIEVGKRSRIYDSSTNGAANSSALQACASQTLLLLQFEYKMSPLPQMHSSINRYPLWFTMGTAMSTAAMACIIMASELLELLDRLRT
jgi:hypothetical protein